MNQIIKSKNILKKTLMKYRRAKLTLLALLLCASNLNATQYSDKFISFEMPKEFELRQKQERDNGVSYSFMYLGANINILTVEDFIVNGDNVEQSIRTYTKSALKSFGKFQSYEFLRMQEIEKGYIYRCDYTDFENLHAAPVYFYFVKTANGWACLINLYGEGYSIIENRVMKIINSIKLNAP